MSSSVHHGIGRVLRAVLVCAALGACGRGARSEPATSFACGDQTCDARTHYCRLIKTDDLRLPSTYTCQALPDACHGEAATCACFAAGTRCDYCAVLDGDGGGGRVRHLQRTCVGGR
jgi:hypothetical protein